VGAGEHSAELIGAYLERGRNFIDTANICTRGRLTYSPARFSRVNCAYALWLWIDS